MINQALTNLPNNKGSKNDIVKLIETQLNIKLEKTALN